MIPTNRCFQTDDHGPPPGLGPPTAQPPHRAWRGAWLRGAAVGARAAQGAARSWGGTTLWLNGFLTGGKMIYK